MSPADPPPPSRREFLTGRALTTRIERAGAELADEIVDREPPPVPPSAGPTVRLETRAMACEFAVLLNPGPGDQLLAASEALDFVHALEDQITVYRQHSEMSRLNRTAAEGPVEVEPGLFDLLRECERLCRETEGAFDPTSGPLIALWRACRSEGRIPAESEIAAARERTGIAHVRLDGDRRTAAYLREDVELNLGGIGKGYALDRLAAVLGDRGLSDFVVHAGYSSVLARGGHRGRGGWPVGIANPLFLDEQFATIVLRDQALSTSGSGVRHFRHGGRRYGHILDPRTGWPAEGMLSVTVLAPTASLADALSTAFFVMGVENARRYCDNNPEVAALIFPPATRGRTLEPVVLGIADEQLFWT
ncbi:MAG TPA: FAD:protein FMN transferase [Planctomycetaceae bacterium]|nr:FAD:protein FMN transferase [Planctomycetaceae bacterium]